MSKPQTILSILFLVTCVACDNEVELFEEAPSVPVVYSFYSSSVDDQEIAVTKTFTFSAGGSDEESASSQDSVYFDNEKLIVEVENLSNGQTVISEREDLSSTGRPRVNGPLPTSPNFVYTYKSSDINLDPGDSIGIEISVDGNVRASSKTIALPEVAFVATAVRPVPTQLSVFPNGQATYRLELGQSEFISSVKAIEIGYNFMYEETEDGVTTEKTLYFPAFQDFNRSFTSAVSSFPVSLENFLPFLAENLESVNGRDVQRKLIGLKAVVIVGNNIFQEFQVLLDANRSGITSSTGTLPFFSNIENGAGLFGSIATFEQTNLASFSPPSADSLVNHCVRFEDGRCVEFLGFE